MNLGRALETSILLAEKVAAARPAPESLLRRRAVADFATFGMFKRAALDPAAMRPLAWGLGLGLPALGAGHLLLRDARHQGEALIRDARNQALMTAAGVGGMRALGDLLKRPTQLAQHHVNVGMPTSGGIVDPSLPGGDARRPTFPAEMAALHATRGDEAALDALQQSFQGKTARDLAAAMIVDDILEEAIATLDPEAKHAALVALVVHRGEAVGLLRGLL